MRKTFYYNFIQTKEGEEDASKANNRVLVELGNTRPLHNYNSSGRITKTLTYFEVFSGKLIIPFIDAFEHVLPYWSLSTANHLVLGHKVPVILYDSTDQANPKRYNSDVVYMEILPNDDYSLSCLDLFKDRFLKFGDEIELFWDQNASNFQFKLLRSDV